MNPKEAAANLWETVKANAAGMPQRFFINTFSQTLIGYLKENYPDPADLQQAIACGEPVLEQALASIPADGLALARSLAGAVAAQAGMAEYDSILAGIGQELPEHEAVLYGNAQWYVAAMESAKAWFLGRQP